MAISETTETSNPIFSPLLRRYTLDEFWALPEPEDGAHYELIGGYLFMAPPPDPPHGDVDAYLNSSLTVFLNASGNPGRVYHPPEAIYTSDTYVEPDMMYVSNELRAKMGSRRSSADIVFEYMSESNANYDRTTKADTYLALGVRELWLVDSETKTVEIRNAIAGEPLPTWEVRRFGHGQLASSQVLPGWQVSVDSLFAGI
ncbi:MAG: Uma2 family endonuclease [Blastocatellia bacterium]